MISSNSECQHSSTCNNGYFCRPKKTSSDLCWPCPEIEESCADKFESFEEITECQAICEGKL